MPLAIHKKGQGYYTRLMSAIAFGTLVLMGCAWLWDVLKAVRIGEIQPVYIAATGAVIFGAVFAALAFLLIGAKPKTVDFMIATEGEMKKVNWSTRREILGSTWVVIALTIFIALLCFVVDLLFQMAFRAMGVLETTT